jgi:diacylglycerol kinase (ATP)
MGENKIDAASAIVVLINPNARGGRNGRLTDRIAAIAREVAPHARVLETRSADHADRSLRELPPQSRVIVAGGDGTVQSVLASIVECDHAFGVLALGSGNDASRALGTYRGELHSTLTRLLTSVSARNVDVGRVEFDGQSKYFLVALNAGFDASIAARAVNGPKWLRGLPRYLLATLRELAAIRHWRIAVSLDDEAHFSGDALFASTLNASTFGSGMPAVPHAQIDDGALDLLVARRFSRGGALAMLPRLLRGTHLSDPRISTCRFRTLQLSSEAPIPLAADGEFLGETHGLTIKLHAQRIMAIV